MKWKKEELEEALKGSFNKREVLIKLGRSGGDYKTLDKYLKLFNLDYNHLKPHCRSIESTNSLKVYTKGDQHPSENLYFWQYRYNRLGGKSFEQWHTKENYDKANEKHKIHNFKYRRNDVLTAITHTSLTREKQKPRHKEGDELINVQYIKELWNRQNGLCFWFNVPMDLKMSETEEINLSKVSIDRLDSNIGYIKGNVVLCTLFANRGRGNSSLEQWDNFVKLLKTNDKIF